MEGRFLSSLGKVAGLGGIALGVFLLLFQGVLEKQFLPEAGLGSSQAFTIILALMILTFGIAGIGIIAWLISRAISPEAPIPGPALGILGGLIIAVLCAVVYVGAHASGSKTAQLCKSPFPPVAMSECETGTGEVCGPWIFEDEVFKASWNNLPGQATVKVSLAPNGQFILHRTDSGPGEGFSGTYVGDVLPNLQEDGKCRIEGSVQWFDHGKFYRSGTWYATWR
jgi:hypothetical protein